eukprot:jgi/Chlat1/8344/Chrsp8S08108
MPAAACARLGPGLGLGLRTAAAQTPQQHGARLKDHWRHDSLRLSPSPSLPHSRRRAWRVCACSSSSSSGDDLASDLAASFARFVNEAGLADPTANRSPTALMPPSAVVAAVMDALMRNDWPEEDAGLRTAYAFAMPFQANAILAGKGRPGVRAARSWHATEDWFDYADFARTLAADPAYNNLVRCASWRPASSVVFPGPTDNRAVQAVKVVPVAANATSAGHSNELQRELTFTFCLEKVLEGAFKGCWMTVGVRVGDYANV